MDGKKPKVTIGLAVFNSDHAPLREVIESMLAQDYENIEVLICDNASTDNTPSICLEYAAKDSRVKYFNNGVNIGAVRNGIRLLGLCTSDFFKIAEHANVLKPSYIRSCMKELLADESIVLCYPRTMMVHVDGRSEIANDHVNAMDDSPVERYLNVITELCYCNAIYGIFRTSVLRSMLWSEPEHRGNDVAFIAETALKGKIKQVEEVLYINYRDKKWSKDMEGQISSVYRMLLPYKPNIGITFPFCRFINEHMDIVRYSSLDECDKVFLYEQTIKILGSMYYPRMRDEIKRAIELIHQRRLDHNWGDSSDGSVQQLDPKKKAQYYYYAGEILKRFEEVMCVCPQFNEPGIHYARAICLTVMDRYDEALSALRIELSRFPEFEPAHRMLAVLEQMLTRRENVAV